MFRQNGGVNARYKAKYRSLIFNMRDPNNPDLRRRVLSGEITGVLPLFLMPCRTHVWRVPPWHDVCIQVVLLPSSRGRCLEFFLSREAPSVVLRLQKSAKRCGDANGASPVVALQNGRFQPSSALLLNSGD
jgi:hypothetical protein